MFHQLGYKAAVVEGDSFHRYTRPEMDVAIRKAREQGRHISYFWPGSQRLRSAGVLFPGVWPERHRPVRRYLHSFDEAVPFNQMPGTFTPGRICPARRICCSTKDCMAAWSREHNVARHVDFLIGVVPIVNLEWIQKLIRDTRNAATPARR
jgi:phosphoribulokinase